MTTEIKTILSKALQTLKANTVGFWESCSYGSCFESNGELRLASIKTVAPALSQYSSQQALDDLRNVLSDYEKMNFFEKFWFRWSEPHPIDVYYQLDEIAVLHELDKAINENGIILNQAVVDNYRKSQLSKKLGWMDKLTEGDWRMYISHAIENDQRIRQQEQLMAKEYNDFKSRMVLFISEAVSSAISDHSKFNTRLDYFKKGLNRMRNAAQKALESSVSDSPTLSSSIKTQKDRYYQSMQRWETFAYNCCHILSEIPSEKLHQELAAKANMPVVQEAWKNNILQHIKIAEQKLTSFINNISNSISDRLKVWVKFEENTKQKLANSCMLYPSERLDQDKTKNTVLGLCYQAHLYEQQLCAEHEGLKVLKERQQQNIQAAAHDRQEQENAQKIVVFDTTPDIVTFIKAENDNLSPDEIPAWIENLVKRLEESTVPEEQVNIFNDILLWQKRYLEAASWGCTSEQHRIATLAEQHLQLTKNLFRKLVLQLHTDHDPIIEKQHVERLLEIRKKYHDDMNDLLNTYFDPIRKQTPWMNRIWVAGKFDTTQGRSAESEREAIEALKTWLRTAFNKHNEKIAKFLKEKEKADEQRSKDLADGNKKLSENAKMLEEHDKMLGELDKNLKQAQEKLEELQNRMGTMPGTSQSQPLSRADSYLTGKVPENYTPCLHKAVQPSHQNEKTDLLTEKPMPTV